MQQSPPAELEILTSKILLIEDNLGDARLVEINLQDSNLDYEILHVDTLQKGLSALGENSFKAVLLDLTLPDSKGFETLTNLLRKFPNENVIVLTGHTDQELGIKAVQKGAQDFLVKGDFSADKLAQSLRYSIERRQNLMQLKEVQRIAQLYRWQYDLSNDVLSCETDTALFLGLSQNNPILLDELPSIHKEVLPSMVEEAKTKEVVTRDVRFTLDGNRVVDAIVSAKFEQVDGRMILMGMVQDVTDRKKVEAESLKNKQRYEKIFNQSKDAIYISTEEGSMIDFNKATEELTGYSRDELLKLDVRTLYVNPAHRSNILKELDENSFVKEQELTIRRKSGEIRYCVVTTNSIELDGVPAFHGIIRDMTNYHQAEEIKKQRAIEERTAKMKEKFLANVSHEMRTPMNAVLGMSNLILKTEMSEEQQNYVTAIKKSSVDLLGIINDILEISSIQFGKIMLDEKVFDLHDMIANLINVMRYKMEEKNLQFELHVDKSVPKFIKGDQLRLNQILINLLGNAVKFTDEGLIRLVLKTKPAEEDGVTNFEFVIKDSGIGIPSDKLPVIFDTFIRVNSNPNKFYQGTGLGLAIVKQLVELQGGTISVESELGVGSTFGIVLPFKDIQDVDIAPGASNEKVLLKSKRDVKILIVEDHALNQIVARKTLEKEWSNVQVTIAGNGREALAMYEKEEFDIILMDLQMPIMDGYETTERIRQLDDAKKAEIPIIAMTAHAHIGKDEKFKEHHMDDCVLKPFQPQELFSTIARYINKEE